MANFILLIHCPDKAGIIATVTNFIAQKGGNITYLDQHVDGEQQLFFMRLLCEFSDKVELDYFEKTFSDFFAIDYQMKISCYETSTKPNVALFVSKYDHCLYEILSKYESGDWHVNIPLVVSNHEDLRFLVERHGLPFHCIPINKENKIEAEQTQLKLLKENKIELVVLARYMQILSPSFIASYPQKIINIHHSFLPAFPGGKPYHSAFQRGVKIVGATSHYVTAELDAGPIIEQDVTRISHIDSVPDIILKGKDLEKIVLSRAIQKHIDRKVLVYNNKTVVFV